MYCISEWTISWDKPSINWFHLRTHCTYKLSLFFLDSLIIKTRPLLPVFNDDSIIAFRCHRAISVSATFTSFHAYLTTQSWRFLMRVGETLYCPLPWKTGGKVTRVINNYKNPTLALGINALIDARIYIPVYLLERLFSIIKNSLCRKIVPTTIFRRGGS